MYSFHPASTSSLEERRDNYSLHNGPFPDYEPAFAGGARSSIS